MILLAEIPTQTMHTQKRNHLISCIEGFLYIETVVNNIAALGVTPLVGSLSSRSIRTLDAQAHGDLNRQIIID